MSVIIRLQSLPWNANALDIRRFFHGLSIPDGGVHIIGGEKGDAFIAFSTDEDARQAMMLSGDRILDASIRLFLSSKTEMQNVITAARGTPAPAPMKPKEDSFGHAAQPATGNNDDFRNAGGSSENRFLGAAKNMGIVSGLPSQLGIGLNRDAGGGFSQAGFGQQASDQNNFGSVLSGQQGLNELSFNQRGLIQQRMNQGFSQPEPFGRLNEDVNSSSRSRLDLQSGGLAGMNFGDRGMMKGSLDSSLVDRSMLDRPMIERSSVNLSLTDRSLLERSFLDQQLMNRPLNSLVSGGGPPVRSGEKLPDPFTFQSKLLAPPSFPSQRDVLASQSVGAWGQALSLAQPANVLSGGNRNGASDFCAQDFGGRPAEMRDLGRSASNFEQSGKFQQDDLFRLGARDTERPNRDSNFLDSPSERRDFQRLEDFGRFGGRDFGGPGGRDVGSGNGRDFDGGRRLNNEGGLLREIGDGFNRRELGSGPLGFGILGGSQLGGNPLGGNGFDGFGRNEVVPFGRDNRGLGFGSGDQRRDLGDTDALRNRPADTRPGEDFPRDGRPFGRDDPGGFRREMELVRGRGYDSGPAPSFPPNVRGNRVNTLSEFCVRLKNLPLNFNYKEIRRHFSRSEIPQEGLKLINDEHGNRSGNAYIQFSVLRSFNSALQMNGSVVDQDHKLIVEKCSVKEYNDAVDNYIPKRKAPARSRSPIARKTLGSGGDWCVVIKKLPPNSDKIYVRKFLGNIRICANGGPFMEVSPTGVRTGNALVEFDRQVDLRDALSLNEKKLDGSVISVIPISKREFDDRAERARKESVVRGSGSKLSVMEKDRKETKPDSSDHRGSTMKQSAESKSSSDDPGKLTCVSLRGLPWACSASTLREFFSGLNIAKDGIYIFLDKDKRPTGTALVHFGSVEDARKALRKDKQYIGKRYIDVQCCTYGRMTELIDEEKIKGARSSSDVVDLTTEESSSEFLVRMQNLHGDTELEDIIDYFHGLHPLSDSIKLQYKDGRPTGEGLVGFRSVREAEKAIAERSFKLMRGRSVTLSHWTSK